MALLPIKNFKKIAIANRGEVAVRIIRACQELGIKNVLLHSEADKGGRAFRMADETICIGPAASSESYLSIERNVKSALAVGADALHPGFGFLSENADFAQAVTDAGMTFIGPRPDSIRLMGDKISARETMSRAGVPVIPGYQGRDQSLATLQREADRIGYPLIVKAAAGGGGRGMKVVNASSEFQEQCLSSKREALAAFGSDVVFLEKYIRGAKHIEFQVFGDQHGNAIHLFERECSVQRRHQKIIEEALSPSLTPELREAMGTVAVKAVQESKYVGAGTVEFLLEGENFYFLEMNTRLQVEHPVTELVVGVDLVKAQILVAQGKPLPWKQGRLAPRGHSIECRLYAEDPYRSGMPSTGPLGTVLWPEGPGRRFDSGVETGDVVTSYYDSMIAKLIVWDESRVRAIDKMLTVLSQTIVFGVKTNIPFLRAILEHPDFQSGSMNIQFISDYFPDGLPPRSPSELEKKILEKARKQLISNEAGAASMGPTHDAGLGPWLSHWRNV